ncbi:MAG TPA: DUF6496 domain-containing protein [Steroidobacteraceae bacterium]
MRTWPAAGSGISRSTIWKSAPAAGTCTTFMVVVDLFVAINTSSSSGRPILRSSARHRVRFLLMSARRVPAGVNPMARYGKKAQSKVKRAMHERKQGTLRSGRSGRKVRSRKQAIAIGLSEARRAGGKVPRKKTSRKKR